MWWYILASIWLLLPASIANMSPVFARKIFGKRFTQQLDFGVKFKGKELLGSHKTFRGLISGIIVGILIAYLQKTLYNVPFFFEISVIDYSSANMVLVGFLLGFGAIFGDLIGSFFKRRLNIKPGAKWIPADQIDFVVGALLLISFVYIPSWQIIITSLIIIFFLHIIVNHIGYYLKLSKTKW